MSKSNDKQFYKFINKIKHIFTNQEEEKKILNQRKLRDVPISEEQKILDKNTYNVMNKTKKLDLKKFNKEFERRKEIKKKESGEKIKKRLGILNKPVRTERIYDQSIGNILINIKNTWIGILDDLMDGNFNLTIFTTKNRLFYIGITIVFISLILFLFSKSRKKIDCSNTKKVFVYKYSK